MLVEADAPEVARPATRVGAGVLPGKDLLRPTNVALRSNGRHNRPQSAVTGAPPGSLTGVTGCGTYG